jgi:Domain of unknown function (DUF4160)
MPVIYRKDGCRFVIYFDDHGPAHVHIIGDGEAKIALEPNVKLIWTRGFRKRDVQKALDVVKDLRMEFLERWEMVHGKIK